MTDDTDGNRRAFLKTGAIAGAAMAARVASAGTRAMGWDTVRRGDAR
jgi:hypothetical protein